MSLRPVETRLHCFTGTLFSVVSYSSSLLISVCWLVSAIFITQFIIWQPGRNSGSVVRFCEIKFLGVFCFSKSNKKKGTNNDNKIIYYQLKTGLFEAKCNHLYQIHHIVYYNISHSSIIHGKNSIFLCIAVPVVDTILWSTSYFFVKEILL